jgi:peptidoglycan/LPS O-acetylase OafA/YrhL
MLAKNPDARLNLGSFALRRFWRIYPTYVAALSVTALVDWWIASRLPAPRPDQVDSVATFIVSLFTLQGYLAPYFGDNGVFWTLAIEVHLYIAYPILFYLTRHHGPQKTVLFTLAVACSYLLADRLFGIQNHLPYRAVQGPVFLPYWFTWAMGFYVAELEAHRAKDFSNRTWIVLMVLGFVLGLPPILHGTHPTFDDLFWAVFFAGFLRWSISPAGERFWSHWYGVSLAAVGVFSYSLYAIHAPVLDVIHILLVPGDTGKFVTLWPTIGAVLIAVLCAWLFFQLVERWSIRPARTVPVNSTERKSHG